MGYRLLLIVETNQPTGRLICPAASEQRVDRVREVKGSEAT